MVQWLRLHASTAGSIPGQGTEIPDALQEWSAGENDHWSKRLEESCGRGVYLPSLLQDTKQSPHFDSLGHLGTNVL